MALVAFVLAGCSRVEPGAAAAEPDPAEAAPTTTATTAARAVAIDGVTVTDETIYLGALADLTGPYSVAVVDVIDAQLAFWSQLNEAGGIDGRRVEILIEDTGYDPLVHVQAYHRLAGRVAMFTHSTGTAQTAAIADLLEQDHRVAVPLTWYSGWSSEPNLIEIGSNYCAEAVNTVSHLGETEPVALALATVASDFGLDSAAGVRMAAERLDLPLVYDGTSALVPGGDLVSVAQEIAASGADWTWLAADPATAVEVIATATQLGYQGRWTGSSPTWNSRALATRLGPLLAETVLVPSLVAPLGSDTDGMAAVMSVLEDRLGDRYPSEALVVGYLEYEATRQILEEATALGDLTPEGIETVARRMAGTGFEGISPAADTPGGVVTATGLGTFSIDDFGSQGGLAATISDGAITPIESVSEFTTSPVAASIDFSRPCAGL
jgi:ABC-type branched-subunit amino acid transport system substrate-binding protein